MTWRVDWITIVLLLCFWVWCDYSVSKAVGWFVILMAVLGWLDVADFVIHFKVRT